MINSVIDRWRASTMSHKAGLDDDGDSGGWSDDLPPRGRDDIPRGREEAPGYRTSPPLQPAAPVAPPMPAAAPAPAPYPAAPAPAMHRRRLP